MELDENHPVICLMKIHVMAIKKGRLIRGNRNYESIRQKVTSSESMSRNEICRDTENAIKMFSGTVVCQRVMIVHLNSGEAGVQRL